MPPRPVLGFARHKERHLALVLAHLDPAALLTGDVRTRVHLVPHRPAGEVRHRDRADEVAALLPVVALRLGSTGPGYHLTTVGSVLAAAPTLLPAADDAVGHLQLEATPAPHVLRLVAARMPIPRCVR